MFLQQITLLKPWNGADSPSLLRIYLHVSYNFIHRRCSNYKPFSLFSWNDFPEANTPRNPFLVAFATYTLANLLPRGLSHHHWYLEKFEDYPKNRKAFIPFLL